jgi:hypothetical protein
VVIRLRPVFGSKGIELSLLSIALTGDGTWESSYVLPALAERFDGTDKALLIPVAYPHVVRGRKTSSRFAGFSILQAVKTYTSEYGVNKYLIVIDKEHSNGRGLSDEAREKLEEYGFLDVSSRLLAQDAASIECKHGSHEICIKATFSGRDKRIEENIAELISLELGIPIEPNKDSIRNTLKQHNLDLRRLVGRARMNNLSRAFPALCAALKSLEASCNP